MSEQNLSAGRQIKKQNFLSSLLSYAREGKRKLILSVILSVISITAALAAIEWRLLLASLITFPLSFICMGLTFKISGKNYDTLH